MSHPDLEKQLAYLEGYCAAHLAEDALDELVNELKAREAAAINNGGVAAQLAYLLASLDAAEAARAIIGAGAELPECFRPGAVPPPECSWRVAYRVCTTDAVVIHSGTVAVLAPNETEAGRRAVARAHEIDPYCDERIDYHVEIVHAQETEGDDDNEQDDPAG